MNETSHHKPSWKFWVSVFVTAAFVRTLFLIFWFRHDLDSQFGADPYVELAQYWLGWRPDANELILHCVSPGFAAWCALLFKIAGQTNLLWIRIGNIALSSATAVLTGLYAGKIAGSTPARVAGIVTALAPPLIFFVPHLQSESFYLLWQMCFFFALWSIWETPTAVRFLGLGFLGGIITLIRSVFLISLPLLLIALWFQSRKWQKPTFVLIFFVIGWMLPVVARTTSNWIFYHKLIPLTAQGGQDLYLGTGRYPEDRAERTKDLLAKTAANGYGYDRWVARDKYLRNEALIYIKSHPVEYMVTVIIKFVRFWRPWPYPPYPLKARVVLGIYYTFLFLLSAVGLFGERKKFLQLLPILTFCLSLSITHAFLDTTLRYRIPLEPLLIVLASIGLTRLRNSTSI